MVDKVGLPSTCYMHVHVHVRVVPLSPPHFTPVKLEHAEQLELGYLPLRDDFEKEHDNTAETLISGMMLGPEDDELEKSLKLAHIDMYGRRLQERERRKRYVSEGEGLGLPPILTFCRVAWPRCIT